MKKTAWVLAFLLLSAVPTFAQTSEFGVLFGGSKRMNVQDEADAGVVDDSFSFNNHVKELYYAVELEPGTRFKVKLGELTGPISRPGATEGTTAATRGDLQFVSGLVDYRFSESFGSTGIFGGVGLYRAQAPGASDDSDYGFQFGLNGDF